MTHYTSAGTRPLSRLGSWSRSGPLYVEPRLSALGVRHGVTTRELGNMKEASARRRALAAAGIAGDALILKQVHGTAIALAAAETGSPAADGWPCARAGVTPAVYVADCLPIFLWDRGGSAVGVFHAGWRGLAAGMPRLAARAFGRFGLEPESLAAAVGPHVGACCYRVGPDVASKFRPAMSRDGRLDLGEEARLQLEESGLAPAEISVSAACTACSPGRMLAFASLPEPHGI